ncbi:hypothetical protein PENTCL1PPCAC_4926, partial [Pristionchus entomophagus]
YSTRERIETARPISSGDLKDLVVWAYTAKRIVPRVWPTLMEAMCSPEYTGEMIVSITAQVTMAPQSVGGSSSSFSSVLIVPVAPSSKGLDPVFQSSGLLRTI